MVGSGYYSGGGIGLVMASLWRLEWYCQCLILVLGVVRPQHWPYLPVRKYSERYHRAWPTWLPSIDTGSTQLGSVTMNHENGHTGAKLAEGTDLRSLSTEHSRVLSLPTRECYVGHSREFAGTGFCTYRQANTPIIQEMEVSLQWPTSGRGSGSVMASFQRC